MGNLSIYKIISNGLLKLLSFNEKIKYYDFDQNTQNLAFCTNKNQISILNFAKNSKYEILLSDLKSHISIFKIIENALILGTENGKLFMSDIQNSKITEIPIGSTISDKITCLNINKIKEFYEISFGTKNGFIGWLTSENLLKIDSILQLKCEKGNLIRKLWTLSDPTVIISIQSNLISLCEKDQHNSLSVFKSLNTKSEIQTCDLLCKNMGIAYILEKSSIISVVSAKNLEILTIIETQFPKYFIRTFIKKIVFMK